MSQPQDSSSSTSRDIKHTVSLIASVIVLFWLGHFFLSSFETSPTPALVQPDSPKPTPEHSGPLAPIVDRWVPKPEPPRSDAWLISINNMKAELDSIASTSDSKRVESIRRRLQLMTEHCNEFPDAIPVLAGSSDLRETLLRIGRDIGDLRSPPAANSVSDGVPPDLAQIQSDEERDVANQIKTRFAERRQPVQQEHRQKMTSLQDVVRELTESSAKTQQRVESVRAETEKAILIAEQKLAFQRDELEIRRLLSPFITPGYDQLGRSWNDWKKTAQKQPLSFRDLEQTGAISPDIDGVTMLARIGGFPQHDNPRGTRPRGAIPPFYDSMFGNPNTLETVKRAQHLLKQHGPYLIEIGLLQP